jgi:hypothetical protein
VIRGGNGIADSPVDHAKYETIMEAVTSRGFKSLEETNVRLDLPLGQFRTACFISVLLYQ